MDENISLVIKAEVFVCERCTVNTGENVCVYTCTACYEPLIFGTTIFCGSLILSAGEHFCSNNCRNEWEQKEKDKLDTYAREREKVKT